jgi:hypothetical protein
LLIEVGSPLLDHFAVDDRRSLSGSPSDLEVIAKLAPYVPVRFARVYRAGGRAGATARRAPGSQRQTYR